MTRSNYCLIGRAAGSFSEVPDTNPCLAAIFSPLLLVYMYVLLLQTLLPTKIYMYTHGGGLRVLYVIEGKEFEKGGRIGVR